MKFLIALAFAGVLLAGCSDSSTEPATSNDGGSNQDVSDDGSDGDSTDTGVENPQESMISGGTASSPATLSFSSRNEISSDPFYNYFTYSAQAGEKLIIQSVLDRPLTTQERNPCNGGLRDHIVVYDLNLNPLIGICGNSLTYTFEQTGTYIIHLKIGDIGISGYFNAASVSGSEPAPEPAPEPEPEPAPSVVKFTGDDFGYLRINTSHYSMADSDYDQNTLDERVAYTVWSVNYVEAQSLLEAMHVINDYREDFQQVKTINGGSQDLDSLINDYCPTSGARFAAETCEFYARLAYSKTMAQDGWQVEHRQNTEVPLVCTASLSKFYSCAYSVMGFSEVDNWGYTGVDGTGYGQLSIGEIKTTAVSPIIAWQYEKNEPKITAINRAAHEYVQCVIGQEEKLPIWFHGLRPALSPWDVEQLDYQALHSEITQYGTLNVWIINDDTVEDVYTDVTAEHDGSNLCKAKFQLDLKEVQPNASF